MGNPLTNADESQSLRHNVQPASKTRITCLYLHISLPLRAYCLHKREEMLKENTGGPPKSCQIRIIWLQDLWTLHRMLTIRASLKILDRMV